MFIPGTEVSPIQFIMYSARERRNARISLNRKHFFNFKTLEKKVIMKQQSKVLALLEVLKKTPVLVIGLKAHHSQCLSPSPTAHFTLEKKHRIKQ